jgi:CBS domain containing-hemolysin-like protein
MSTSTAIWLAILLLLGNAFFVGAEFALISARRSRIEPMAEQGNRRARVTLRSMEQVSLMMAGAQLGITVCSLGLGALGEPAVAALIEPGLEALGLPSQILHPLAFAIALAIVVYLHMVLGEMVPKNIALAGPERSALLLGPPLAALVTVLRPVIWLINSLANLVLLLLRVEPQDEVASAFTSDEVSRFVQESRSAGLLEDEEHRLVTSALEVTERAAGEVAVPLDQLVTVPAGAPARDIQDVTASTGFSRILITAADGRLVGYTHVKDTLEADPGAPAGLSTSLYRTLPPVLGTSPVTDAVATLRADHSHLALVLDDGGQATGVLFLEDALEELIGEVEDAEQVATG